jgi:hypothetical protein
MASAVALLGRNASLFFWPVGLNPARTFDLGPLLVSPWPWVTLLGLAAALWFRKRAPQLTFLAAWWAVTLIPCLDIRQLGVPKVADRFSYMPSVGLCLAIALTVLVLLPSWLSRPGLARMLAPVLALLAVFWASQTLILIPIWKSDTSLMVRVRAEAPDAAWPHVAEGDILRFQEGDLDGSEREYQTALRLASDPARERSPEVIYDSFIGLGGVAQERGQDQQALIYFQKAADTLPQLSNAYDSLGAYYFPRQDYATASLYFSKAVKANPQDVVAHIYLGNCWMKLAKFKDAAAEFHAAREVDPSLKQAYMSEARALDALGESEAAAKVRRSFH